MTMPPVKLLNLLPVVLGVVAAGCLGSADQIGSVSQDVAAPTGLVATFVTAQQVFLSWNPIADSTATYVVLRGMAPGTETTLSSTAPAGTTMWVDKHDTPNTQYCFEVVAVAGGAASGPSNEVCVTTSPGPVPPTGVQAVTTSATSINVSWNSVSGNARYVILESVSGGSFNAIAAVSDPTVSFLVEGLTPGTTYSFEIETLVPVGLLSAPSAPATATTFGVNLEDYYQFDEKTGTTTSDATPAKRDGVLGGGAVFTTADHAPLVDVISDHNPSSVQFPTSTANVTASGSVIFGGVGDASISLWVKLPVAPPGPLSIIGRRAAGCGPATWLLAQDATHQLNFAGSAASSFGTTLPVNQWTQVGVAQHGSLIQMYINGVQVASSTTFAAGTVSAAPLQIGDVGGCGNGGPLLVDEVRIFSRFVDATEMASLGTRPPAPTGLTVTETHSTFIRFSWTPVPNADHYLVFKGSASETEAFFTSNQTTSFLGDHLSPNETTFWQVEAVRSASGLLSNLSAELTATSSPPPPAPVGLTATLDACCTPQRVDLAWSPVANAAQYVIYQSTSGGPFVAIGSTLPTVTSFEVAGLTSGTSYAFEVQTKDDGGTLGPLSAPASATVP